MMSQLQTSRSKALPRPSRRQPPRSSRKRRKIHSVRMNDPDYQVNITRLGIRRFMKDEEEVVEEKWRCEFDGFIYQSRSNLGDGFKLANVWETTPPTRHTPGKVTTKYLTQKIGDRPDWEVTQLDNTSSEEPASYTFVPCSTFVCVEDFTPDHRDYKVHYYRIWTEGNVFLADKVMTKNYVDPDRHPHDAYGDYINAIQAFYAGMFMGHLVSAKARGEFDGPEDWETDDSESKVSAEENGKDEPVVFTLKTLLEDSALDPYLGEGMDVALRTDDTSRTSLEEEMTGSLAEKDDRREKMDEEGKIVQEEV